MALIKCTECGRDLSDKAAACPGCGAPIPSSSDEVRAGPNAVKAGFASRTQWLILCLIVAATVVLALAFGPGLAERARSRPVLEDASPGAQQRRLQRGVLYCESRYKEMSADRQYGQDELKFHSATCRKMRDDYRTKYGREP